MTNSKKPTGVAEKEYVLGRKTNKAWRYRLQRRTYEAIQAIKKYASRKDSILDIGTAEGLTLGLIKKNFPSAKCVGIEYNQELIEMNQDNNIEIIQGDAQSLPFFDNSFNIATCTAVIEHLDKPFKMITESYRILKKNGILIVTVADPFFDKIADLMPGYDNAGHICKFNLKRLKDYFQKANFQILTAEKFMISPFGFPAELKIEKLIKLLNLDFLLFNQLIVGKK